MTDKHKRRKKKPHKVYEKCERRQKDAFRVLIIKEIIKNSLLVVDSVIRTGGREKAETIPVRFGFCFLRGNGAQTGETRAQIFDTWLKPEVNKNSFDSL